MNTRNEIVFTLFGAIKFFLSTNTALQVSVLPSVAYIFGGAGYPWELAAEVGFVHYLF